MTAGSRTVHHGHMQEIAIDGPTEAHGRWGLADYIEWPSDSETGERHGMKGYGDEGRLFLVGSVRYDEPRLSLTSNYLTYYQKDERVVANGNVNAEQYEALLAIKAFASPEGLTISQLSERLQIKHHSAVNIVDRLVERKLITRETAEVDRRRRHLGLTAKGEKFIEELAGVHRKEIRNRSAELIKALERLKK